MKLVEEAENESGVLTEEDYQDIASVYFANKEYAKALEALDEQESAGSLLLIGRIQFDLTSYKEAVLTFIRAEQALMSYSG